VRPLVFADAVFACRATGDDYPQIRKKTVLIDARKMPVLSVRATNYEIVLGTRNVLCGDFIRPAVVGGARRG
jgi:hypothetical protein